RLGEIGIRVIALAWDSVGRIISDGRSVGPSVTDQFSCGPGYLFFGKGGHTGLEPGVESALEGVGVESALGEFLRHTGAGSLVRSGAVGDDRRIPRDLRDIRLDVV